MQMIEEIFFIAMEVVIKCLEIFGVIIIVQAAVTSFVGYFQRKPGLRLSFAQSMATALEFKLAGEILRTVIVREWKELLLVGAIILLRAALAFLINWEIKNEMTNEPSDNKKD